MATKPNPSNSPEPIVDEQPQQPQCRTKWDAFEKAGLRPKTITCEGYFPVHRVNLGCHTNILLNADTMVDHVRGEHGGGFTLVLVQDGRKWDGWQRLRELGAELHDFRCDVCDREVPLVPNVILKHFQAHSGRMRRPIAGGAFLATIKFDPPVDGDEELF